MVGVLRQFKSVSCMFEQAKVWCYLVINKVFDQIFIRSFKQVSLIEKFIPRYSENVVPLSPVKFSVKCYQPQSPKPGTFSDTICVFFDFWPVEGFFYARSLRRPFKHVNNNSIKIISTTND